MTLLRIAAACALLLAATTVASAQAYPSRPITMVVPFAAGGPVDTVARILSEPMRASLGQSIIVENVVAFEVARALVEKFGNDSLQEMQARHELFLKLGAER